jgi:hypothetical protein
MADFWNTVAESWQHHVIDDGRLPALGLFAGFFVAFVVVRSIVYLIRVGKGPFRDAAVGGVHLHHLVYGIFLMLGSGFVGFAISPDIPSWILPLIFGVGAALTLDEFALWLRLEDVYWQDEGRLSVDAALLAVCVAALAVIGAPFAVAVYQKSVMLASASLGATHFVVLLFAVAAYLKGKRATAIVGLLILPAAVVGAVRLARPGSRWAVRFYDSEKTARAEARFERDHPRSHGLGALARKIASDPLDRAATLPDE